MVVRNDSIVLIVRHVKAAGLVHRDAGRIVQAVGAYPTAGKLESAAGAKDTVGERVGGQRSVVLEYPVVEAVRHVKVARPVDRQARRNAHAAGSTDAAAIANLRGEAAALSEDIVRGGVTGAAFAAARVEWSVVLQHPVIVVVRDVEVARPV